MKKLLSLSVFFPAYNEAENLTSLIDQSVSIFPQFSQKLEFIIVNDGSTDNTEKIISQLKQKYKQHQIRLVNHPKNLGYGESLKTGIKSSQYEWIFYSDADLQFDFNNLADFIPHIDKYDVIIGYRQKRSEGFKRSFNASLFKFYIDLLFRLHVKDIDCAFKLFRAKHLKSLTLHSGSAFTSSEILYLLKKKHLKFKQIPVAHYPRRYGNPTGANFKVIIKACYEALATYLKIKLKIYAHS